MFEQKQRTFQRPSLGSHKIGDENKKTFRENARKFKGIGMGYEIPKEGIVGANFIDKKCPFTGNVSIRGKILRGEVKTAKMERTIVVRMNYLQYIKKYKRYEKRHKNISAHCSPAFHVKEGDVVEIGECRPLSKTVKFNVINISRKGNGVFTNKAI